MRSKLAELAFFGACCQDAAGVDPSHQDTLEWQSDPVDPLGDLFAVERHIVHQHVDV